MPSAATGQEVQAEGGPLVADAAPPPRPLSNADRVPPLAKLDEDGLRNPRQVKLSLSSTSPDEIAPGVVPLPMQGGPELDLFAIGSEGAHAAVVYPDQVNLQDVDGSWNHIRLVKEIGTGWLGTFANGTVRFPTQLSVETPIRLTFDEGTITTAPVAASLASGTATNDTVTYADALPSTDLIYHLTPHGTKELIVLKNAAAAATISYSIGAPGFELRVEPTGEVSFVRQNRVVAVIPQPAVWDSSPSPKHAFATYSVTTVAPGEFTLEVSLDASYLAAASYPVTIDPGKQLLLGVGNDDTYVASDAPNTDFRTSWLQVANGTVEKRAFVRFNTTPLQRDDRIIYEATFNLYAEGGPVNGPLIDARRVTQAWPGPLTWNTQPTVDPQVFDSLNCPFWCGGWMEGFDLADMYQHILQTDIATPWTDHGIRVSTDGSASYTFRSAESAGGPILQLTWNDLPQAPNLDRPASGFVFEDDTPTLKVEGGAAWPSDPNGDDVLVRFQLSTHPTDFTGSNVVWNSPWLDSRSYVVPSGILVDGQTYYWRAQSGDVCGNIEGEYWMCSNIDALGVEHERGASNIRSFTVVLKHLGEDERWAMWEHELGNAMELHVNEANGNLFLDVPLDSLATPVGDLHVGLTYNSQQEADYGLSRGWDVSIGAGGSLRDMPIELVKLPDYPNNGVKIRLRGGRLQFFPHRDHRVFATVTAGAGMVRENADGGFIFVSPAGDRYEFSQTGRLLAANPVSTNLASGQNAIRYTYDAQNQLEKVTDPLGRRVNLTWAGGRLELITTWAGQTWDLTYHATNGRLTGVSVTVRQNAADPTSPSRTETVGFSYLAGSQLPGGLLAEIDDGVTQASGATGWTAQYVQDSNGNWRVSQLTPPPGGGPVPLESWHFQYLGEIKGSTAATACVTDPVGTPDTTAPIACDQTHQTIVDFNWTGLPIRIAGPADQTGYWPVTTFIWDTNNNLLCRREPAANAVNEITGPNLCQSDKLSTIYSYEGEAPFRLLAERQPSPATDGSADRLRKTYQYDSDTNGGNYNGLWVEKYENANLSGIPADESVSSDFDANWGTGSPPGLTNTDNFSLRWTGLINTNSWSGDHLRKVFFRITSEEGVSLTIGNKVLLSCLGTTQPAGSYNCGTNQDVKKWLTPDSLHPVTIEYSDLTGPASLRLQWRVEPDTSFGQIPAHMLQTNLGLLTVEQTMRVSADGTVHNPFIKRVSSFPDDDAKARHIPDFVAVTDLDSGVVRKTAFTYNSFGQVRTVTTAAATTLAATTTYSYDNADPISCLSSVEEPGGAVTNHVCNAAGDVTSSTQIVRPVAGTNHTTQQSRVTTTEYDTLGRVTKVSTPWGGSTSTTYDQAGRRLEIDQLLGAGSGHDAHAFTSYRYDDAGHLTRETLPEMADPANPGSEIRPVIQHTYNWLDTEVRRIDERGKEWDFAYDAYRRLIQTETPSGLIAQTEFRLRSGSTYQHRMTNWTPPGQSGGVPTVTSYDVLGRTTSTQTGTINATTFLYDVQSQMTRETPPSGAYTTYTYNRFGDVLTLNEFSGTAPTTNTYDAAGRLQKVNGPRLATDVDDSVSYTYDSQDRLETATQNGITLPGGSSPGVTTTYVWNDADERIKVTQPLSTTQTLVRNWMYDPTNRTSSYADAAGTTTSTHDLSGTVTSVADPRGITLNFEHDNLGRLTRRFGQQDQTVVDDQQYGYDLAGNQLTAKVASTGHTVTSEYDNDGRLLKVYQNAAQPTTTYAYNASTGRMSSITDPAGMTSFAYNTNSLLNQINDPFSTKDVVYTFDTAGRITMRTDGSGLCWSQTYESGTGLPDIRNIRVNTKSCTGTVLSSSNLGYNKAGSVTSRTQTITGNSFGGAYTYTYDAAERLLTASGPAAFGSRTYAYDGAGNRVSVRVGAGTPVTTTYSDAGLPTSSSDGTTYSHDQIGNLTGIDQSGTSNDWFFTYSSWSTLTKAARTATGSDVTYTLDALDRLLSRTLGGSTASYTYQGVSEVLARADVAGTATTYAYTPGGPLAQRTGSTTRYYLRDQHGDVIGLANTSASLVGTTLYDPWGQVLSATGEMATPAMQGTFGFQSDLTDPSTGQVDMLTRMYEPTLGRFSARDVVFGDPTSPVSLNQFIYGAANPITFVDPTGMLFQHDGGGGSCNRSCQSRNQEEDGSSDSPLDGDSGDPPTLDDPVGVSPVDEVEDYLQSCFYQPPRSPRHSCIWQAQVNAAVQIAEGFTIFAPIDLLGDPFSELEGDENNPEESYWRSQAAENAAQRASAATSTAKIMSYREARKLTEGKGGSVQAHHIIEKRHLERWGINHRDTPAVVLTREQHDRITSQLRRALPYGGTYTREQVLDAYQRIYPAEWIGAIADYFYVLGA